MFNSSFSFSFHGQLHNVMRTVWSLLILLVSVLQGNVYLRCVYLISLYNAGVNGCSLKPKLKLLNVKKGKNANTIPANSPVYGTVIFCFPVRVTKSPR